jgi:DNA-binding transcriptional ArsR family regulator
MKAIKVVDDPEKFKLLADDTRRRIIFLLRAKEMTVAQIASNLEVTPQAIYHHIKKLQDADLVMVEREERVGHLIESYYRATAEAFLCSVGATPSGKEFFEKQMKTTLESLVQIGFKLEFDEDDVQALIDKEDELLRCCGDKEYEENVNKLDLDTATLAVVKEYGKILAMTDDEYENQLRLKMELRDALKALLKK